MTTTHSELLTFLSIVILSENVDCPMRSGALGMRLMANRGVNFLAPLAFGVALEWAGFGAPFALTGMLIVLCAFMIYALTGYHLADAEQKKPAKESPAKMGWDHRRDRHLTRAIDFPGTCISAPNNHQCRNGTLRAQDRTA